MAAIYGAEAMNAPNTMRWKVLIIGHGGKTIYETITSDVDNIYEILIENNIKFEDIEEIKQIPLPN